MNKKVILFTTIFLSSIFLTGCAGSVKNMQTVTQDDIQVKPDEGKAMVIFMRPSTYGSAIQSSVFEINDNAPKLVGIVAALKKTTYQVEPGKHLFMVVGESADFMSADLEANKTYYAFLIPRAGMWKARFSLKPIHPAEFGLPELKSCLIDSRDKEAKATADKANDYVTHSCDWVQASAASNSWASSNMPDIQAKYEKYYKSWMKKDVSKRPSLNPEDGQ